MNTRQLNGTTSHTPPSNQTTLEPERLGDVEEGAAAPDSEVDELGLTASEREAWDAMEAEGRGQQQAQPGEAEEAPPVEQQAPAEGEEGDDEEDDEDDQAQAAQQREPQKDGKQGKGKNDRVVSRHKYSKDLNKREQQIEELRQRLNQREVDFAKLSERLTLINEALMTQPPADPAQAQQQAEAENPWLEKTIPVEEDAIQAMAQMQRRLDYNARQQSQHQERFQETEADRTLVSSFNRDIQRYSATEEGQNFGDAYAFLKNSRLVEISVSLFDKDPTDPNEVFTQPELNQIIETFNNEEKWVVQSAIEKQKSPAAAIMRLAKGRGWKFTPPEAGQDQQAQPAKLSPQNGGRPQPPQRQAPPAAPQQRQQTPQTAADKLAAEAAGAAASRSLSDGGGAPPQEQLGVDQLLRMSDEEFGMVLDNMPKGRLDQLLGKEQPRAY